MEYIVNVRAVVRGGVVGDDGAAHPVWEVYHYEAPGDDGIATVSCDTRVRVTADSDAEAIQLAKDDAPPIDIGGVALDDVRIWVDEGIDVEKVETAHA